MKFTECDAQIDRLIIIGMAISADFIRMVQPIYKPEFLKAPFAITVAGWCIKYYTEYAKAPGFDLQRILESEERKGINETQTALIRDFIKSLSVEFDSKKGQFDIQYVYDEAKKLFHQRGLELFAEKFQILIHRGQIDQAEDLLKGYRSPNLLTIHSKGSTAKELMEKDMKEIRWVIEGVIPEGLTLFAGKPKVGKSFFVLNVAIDLSTGSDAFGSIPTEPAAVLYLALEDPESRIQGRLLKMLKNQPAPDNLHIVTVDGWPRIHEGGMDGLETWMLDHPDTRLVIVDTLERFKRPGKTTGYFYSDDYQNLAPLQEFANKHHIGVLVVHHTKKTSTKDPFDEITGSVGLTAAADTLAKLDRPYTGRGEGRIFTFRGRDVGEGELSFRFEDCGYVLEGEAAEQFQGSDSRRAIINYLEATDEPVPRKELVEVMEKQGVGKGIDTIISKMVKNGDIQKLGYGVYAHHQYNDGKREKAFCKNIHERLNRNWKKITLNPTMV